MSLDFSEGSPLSVALHGVIQPKLVECGWTASADDATLSEYIVLMLANGQGEQEIASNISSDLLDMPPDNPETQQFARWLFEQIPLLDQQLSGGSQVALNANDNLVNDQSASMAPSAQDTDMGETAASSTTSIPTGPKAMRNGSSSKQPGGKRMLDQLNRNMGRSDDPLRRTNNSRINAHSRDPPRGPRGQHQMGRGMAALANGRGMGNVNLGGGMNGMGNMGGMPGMPGMGPIGQMDQMDQDGMGQNMMQQSMLNPQQQMALLQMYEQQAAMMQQLLSGQTPNTFVNPNFQGGNRGKGKSLSDRIEKRNSNKHHLPHSSKFSKKEGQDETMTDNAHTAEGAEGNAMDVETSRPDPSNTMCRFNTTCTKADCSFVHQSPAAPPGVAVDMSDTCAFGAACMNKKCTGKHPSPAQRTHHQSEVDCKYFPNCRDQANCPYRHPAMPPCRNGADCKVEGCKFTHSPIACRYNPCTNRFCQYKHTEGQKREYQNKQWTADKNGEQGSKDHVSERKFVDEDGEEELILPGRAGQEEVAQTSG